MKEPILEVNNLRVSFRTYNGNVQAVRGIDFKLFEGETLAIVGESGSGKSVTTKAILGILPKNSIIEDGQILYKGDDLTKYKEKDFYKLRGKEISLIFQDPLSALNPIMRIGKQITEALVLREHMTKEQAHKRALELMDPQPGGAFPSVSVPVFRRYAPAYCHCHRAGQQRQDYDLRRTDDGAGRYHPGQDPG